MIYLEWRYFVSYLHKNGYGNGDYLLDKRLDYPILKDLHPFIEKTHGVDGVTIINWKLLGVKIKLRKNKQ